MTDHQKKTFNKYGYICECYFGLGLNIREIANMAGCSTKTVSEAISLYLKKPKESINLKSGHKLYKGRKQTETNSIIDLEIGIYYQNAKELSIAIKRPHKTVCSWLTGERNQKNFRFKIV